MCLTTFIITIMTAKRACTISELKDKLDADCFLYLVRKDRRKLSRATQLLKTNEEIKEVVMKMEMEPKVEEEMKRGEWSTRRDGRGMDSRLTNCYCPSSYNTKEDAATMTSTQSIHLLLILSDQHDHKSMKMM